MTGKEFVVSYTVTTNVTQEDDNADGLTEKLSAIQAGLEYGLGTLIAQGEYNLSAMTVDSVGIIEEEGDDEV